MRLLSCLAAFLRDEAEVRAGDGIVLGFSGGADSTALLYGLSRLAPGLGLRLLAAHLDHGLDPGSAARAAAAAAAARTLGVPFHGEARLIPLQRRGGSGLEAEARRIRYDFLEEMRRRHGARLVATAHHRDDQAETVLLRARFGSGPLGLGGIQRRRGAIVRPLLDLDRAELVAALVAAGIGWIEDPTNRDSRRPRNRLRRVLAAAPNAPSTLGSPVVSARLGAIAERARGAREAVDQRLGEALDARREFDGASVEFSAMRRLSSTLVAPALAMLHRQAGLEYPASRRAAMEIERQWMRGDHAACDCGRGYGWEVRGSRLHLVRGTRAEPAAVLFTYTLVLPGELQLKELSLRFCVFPAPSFRWAFDISPRRAALALPHELGNRVTVRNRRPGDRIRPLGWDTSCRVKDLLINRKVSRRERHRLPLLASGENVLWIPGVTIDDRCRVTPGTQAWIAEIHDLEIAPVGAAPSQLETPRTVR